jgi:hypothetical protein
MAVEHDGYFHRDAIFAAVEGMDVPVSHFCHPHRHAAMRVMEFIGLPLPRFFMR